MDNSFEEIMVLYNKNFRDYNENMRLYIEIMKLREERLAASAAASAAAAASNRNTAARHSHTTFPPLHTRRRIYPIHTPDDIQQDDLYNYTLPNHNPTPSHNQNQNQNQSPSPFSTIANLLTRSLIRQTNINDLEDVVVYPSNEQIRRATEIIVFNRDGFYNNTTCPITLEPFTNREQVCRIKHCSHIFKRDAIISWFSRNVRCPVCRYDIRDYVENRPFVEEPDNDDLDENFRSTRREEVAGVVEVDDADDDDDDDVTDVDIDRRGETIREDPRLSDIFTTAVRELLQEQILENASERNRTHNMRGLRDASNNNVRRPIFPIAQNFTSSIRNFITNEISQLPLAAELLYTFDIPIVLDISNNRI